MPVMDPTLTHAYDTCRRMHRRHDPTYYWATRRLPADVRPATHALYGYVRTADQLVDGPRRAPTPEARRAALDAWEGELARGLEQGGSENPVVGALVDAARRHDLPLSELRPYMRSMRVDCDEPVRIASESELDRYMEGSAATVGLIMAPLLGAPPEAHGDIARLGVAFQLTNFLRDVAVDWRLDRVYLPGLPEDALRARTATAAVRERVAHHVGHARALFAETAPATDALTPAMRPGIRVARGVYARVLDRVERNDYDVIGTRVALAPWEGVRAAAGSVFAPR